MTPEERAAVDNFIANGGQVKRVPMGRSGEVFKWDAKAGIIRTVVSIHRQKHFGFGDQAKIAAHNRERHRVMAERREAVRKLHAEGHSNLNIANTLGLNQELVRADVKRMGLKSNPCSTTPRGIGEEATRLLNEGYTRTQVAAALGVSRATVQYHDMKRRHANG